MTQEELIVEILGVLKKQPGLKAREIARELGTDRREINRILYTLRGTSFRGDDDNLWYLLDEGSHGTSHVSGDVGVDKPLDQEQETGHTQDLSPTPDIGELGMKWRFLPQLPGHVETEVTQRDQFRNDDVDLSDTIVREAIQNSLDAVVEDGGQVIVTFRWLDESHGLDSKFMESLFDGQLKHAKHNILNIDEVEFSNPTALVIEDFGTCGLTGSVTTKDDDNFSDFWRRHGKSHKTGKSRGRWGLGKLVYSTASQLSAFFGATVRDGDPSTRVMGQTVLGLRKVNGVEYPPHAFFADMEGEDILTQIQVPLKDDDLAQYISSKFSLERHGRCGLSVVIPFPTPDLERDRMIGVAIENYFYPVITGQLVLRFDGIEINADNIREMAHQYAGEHFKDIDILFDFINEVHELPVAGHLVMNESWADDHKLDEDDFADDDAAKVRDQFASGHLVGLKLPITLKKKSGVEVKTAFRVYIKRPEAISKGIDLYVRGGLTLPQESKFKERKALGAMIAEDEAICSFLGDAENAAHTRWIMNAEKLRANYRRPQPVLRMIKFAVLNLYDMLAEVTEDRDELALSSFFWTKEPEGGTKRKKQKKTPIDVPPLPEPKPKLFFISENSEGFTVGTTKHAKSSDFPTSLRLTVAYDVAAGNPFKKYAVHDFRLGNSKSIKLALSKDTATLVSRKENVIELEITGEPFLMKATGFDPNRDIKVKLATGA